MDELAQYARPEDVVVSTLFDQLNRVETSVSEVLAVIPTMTSEQLDAGIQLAQGLENASFVIRGAMVAEKRSRAEKLLGGRGNTDESGVGKTAVVKEIANELGMSRTQLEEDARIVETFRDEFTVKDDSGNEQGLSQDILPRQFFANALKAENPQEALDLAKQKRDELGTKYTASQFAQDIQSTKQGTPTEKIVEQFHVRSTLDAEDQERFGILSNLWGKNESDTIREAVKIVAEQSDVPLVHQHGEFTIMGAGNVENISINDTPFLKYLETHKRGNGLPKDAQALLEALEAENGALKARLEVDDPPKTGPSNRTARLTQFGAQVVDLYLEENPGLQNPQVMDRALNLLRVHSGLEIQ